MKITCKKIKKTVCKLVDTSLLHQKFNLQGSAIAVYPLYQTVFIENANQ